MLVANDTWRYEKDGFKCFAYCPGYVVSDLAGGREAKVKVGAGSPAESAQGILNIVNGHRDADVGKFVYGTCGGAMARTEEGVYPW